MLVSWELVLVLGDGRRLASADRGEIHLEHRTSGELVGEPVRTRVVARAEEHHLRHPAVECGAQVLVDEPVTQRHIGRACRTEGAKHSAGEAARPGRQRASSRR
jgi:hypothetical protein